MKLQEYEQIIEDALYNNTHPEINFLSDRQRGLYHNFLHRRYKAALVKMFPRLEEFISLDWEFLSREYFKNHPPKAYELNALTYNFPEFLKSQKSLPPWAVELAQYEVAEFQVFLCPLESFIPDSIILRLNKSLLHFKHNFNIASWIQILDSQEISIKERENLIKCGPQEIENHLIISRDFETHLCLFTQVNEFDLILIELLKDYELSPRQLMNKFYEVSPELKIIPERDLEARISFLKKQHILY